MKQDEQFMSGVGFIAEERIREAQAGGDFDNLPGQGQPLRLVSDRLPQPLLAYQVLHNAGFTHPRIEEKQEIEKGLEQARSRLERAWSSHDGSNRAEVQWQQAVIHFQEETAVLNQRILTFNLKAPAARLHLHHVDPAQEITRICQDVHRVLVDNRPRITHRRCVGHASRSTLPAQPTLAQYRYLLTTYLRPQWPKVALLATFLFANIGLQLANPQILRAFIDAAWVGGTAEMLANAALLFIAVVVLAQAASALALYMAEDVGWTATNALRGDLALRLLQMDLSFHQERPPGEVIERIDGDVVLLNNFFSNFVLRLLGNGLLLAGILVILFAEHFSAGATVATFVAVAGAILYRIRNVAVPAFQADRQKSAEALGFWEERLLGTADIRANGAILYVMRQQQQLMRQLLDVARRAGMLGYTVHGAYIVIDGSGFVLAFGLGAYLYYSGHLTVGAAYLIFHYVSLVTWNLRTLVYQLDDLQRATASIARINELYHAPDHLPDGWRSHFPAGPVSLVCDNVSFGYTSDTPILHNISFSLQPGQVLGLLGHTGSGKSTLARLLFRFYDPDTGAIYLEGADLRDWRLAALRKQVGMVTQNVQLFQATVRDNLTFFDSTTEDSLILELIAALGLQSWYDSLPDGLDTMLAADGGGLSAGEAQLLAFMRVFLQDPSLVILDEASSRLDPATEQLIERAIDRLLQNRTAIIIAHRLHTVQRADTILILENGRTVEHGPRQALAADAGSRFRQLLQT